MQASVDHAAVNSGLEIRVHGIGNHEVFSALDGPSEQIEEADGQVLITAPPVLPPNRLYMIDWTRASRKINANVLWYFAFPFTLLNVAGYMEVREKSPLNAHRLAVFVVGLCMTLSMAIWLAVMVETVWRWVVPSQDGTLTRVALSLTSSAVLAFVVAYRTFRGRNEINRGNSSCAAVTIAALAALAIQLYCKPATMYYPHSDRPVDVMALVVAVTTGVALVVALGLSITAWWTRIAHRRDIDHGSKDGACYAGAALICLMAMVLLHAAGSILRLAISSIADAFVDTHGRSVRVDAILLYQPTELNSDAMFALGAPLRIDLVPILLLELIVVFAVVLRIVFGRRLHDAAAERRARRREQTGYRATNSDGVALQPMSAPHDLLSDITTTLPVGVLASTVLVIPLWIATVAGIFALSSSWLEGVVALMKVLGLIVVVIAFSGRPYAIGDKLRVIFGKTADIAGFWSPDLHPLAGTSYRRFLTETISETLKLKSIPQESVALVGHSQGSVVSAWFIATRGLGDKSDRELADLWDRREARTPEIENEDTTRAALTAAGATAGAGLTLITCGCPLNTLYATFFPRFFGTGFFAAVRDNSVGIWLNYWRQTDPIASPVPGAMNVNVTETDDEPRLGHGKYFTNSQLREGVAFVLGTGHRKASDAARAARKS